MLMKMHGFRKYLLDHEDFFFCNDFEQPLQNTENLKFFAGKYLPPLHEIFVQEIPIQNFFICQPIFKIFAAHFATN